MNDLKQEEEEGSHVKPNIDPEHLVNIAIQTDEELIYNYAWTKFYHYFQQSTTTNVQSSTSSLVKNENAEPLADQTSSNNETNHTEAKNIESDMKSPNNNSDLISDQECFYDCQNGIYFDKRNALYYDQSKNLYFDNENGVYYNYILNKQTGTYQLRYHSKFRRKDWKLILKRMSQKNKMDNDDVICLSSHENDLAKSDLHELDDHHDEYDDDDDDESESSKKKSKKLIEKNIKLKCENLLTQNKISSKPIKKENHRGGGGGDDDDDDDDEDNDDEEIEDGEIEDLTNKYPPCIRAILLETSSNKLNETNNVIATNQAAVINKLGSLYLIPYTGGTIGRNSKSNLIDFLNEKDIEKHHATIEYNLKKKSYFVRDEDSKNGTYLNEDRLKPKENYAINHGDKLKIGKNVCLLLHIHVGTNTCINCEPGEVMHKIKLEKQKQDTAKLKSNIEEARREANKAIKKKYGLSKTAEINEMENKESLNDAKYVDRAKLRREKCGVDTSHIEMNKNPISVIQPIPETNMGMKLLKNMGWKEGTGLGKLENGIVEPISAKIRISTSGLGYENSELSLDANDEQKKKLISWNKTKHRYNLINKQSKKQLENIFNDEEDDDDDAAAAATATPTTANADNQYKSK